MNAPRIGSLCTGYGGLDMAVEAVLGGELAWISDIDKGACKVLAHRYPDVPNLGDFMKTNWATVQPVDVLAAGFPCQPVSGAGKGMGDQDERWLWDAVHRAVREIRPGVVVLENVRGLVSKFGGRLFARVLGSLADIGYDANWHGLKASDIGAPHGRWRIFIVATDTERGGRDGWTRAARGRSIGRTAVDRHPQGPLLPTPGAYDAERGGPQHPAKRHHNGNGHGKSLAIELQRVTSGWGPYAAAVERWERVTGQPAPSPDQKVHVREWMMGLPAGWVTDVPDLTDREKIKALGNGVVPQQATAACVEMLSWAVAA